MEDLVQWRNALFGAAYACTSVAYCCRSYSRRVYSALAGLWPGKRSPDQKYRHVRLAGGSVTAVPSALHQSCGPPIPYVACAVRTTVMACVASCGRSAS